MIDTIEDVVDMGDMNMAVSMAIDVAVIEGEMDTAVTMAIGASDLKDLDSDIIDMSGNTKDIGMSLDMALVDLDPIAKSAKDDPVRLHIEEQGARLDGMLIDPGFAPCARTCEYAATRENDILFNVKRIPPEELCSMLGNLT